MELAAECLDDLAGDLAFLGGATIGLWVSDPAAPSVRATEDVDAIVAVTYQELDAFSQRLRERGFFGDPEVICRHRHPSGLVLDVMPVDGQILGFGNQWYRAAAEEAAESVLPSGKSVRVVTPPWLVATKLAAFRGRGGDDPMSSADFEDIVRLVDGRQELDEEVQAAPADLRGYIAAEMADLAARADFEEAVEASLPPDPGNQARAGLVIDRWQALAASGT